MTARFLARMVMPRSLREGEKDSSVSDVLVCARVRFGKIEIHKT